MGWQHHPASAEEPKCIAVGTPWPQRCPPYYPLFCPLRRNHLSFLHFLPFSLFLLLLQVRIREQFDCSYKDRRRRGEIGRNLGLVDLLGRRLFVPHSKEALQSSPRVNVYFLVLLETGVYAGNYKPWRVGDEVLL